MGFTFAARILLELGKELISSDDVALYELIKNAFDAQSSIPEDQKQIRVDVQTIITRSALEEALSLIEEGYSHIEICDKLRDNILSDGPEHAAQRFITTIYESAIKKRSSSFINAVREAYKQENWLKITDQGHGMSLSDLSDIFLRIGTRSRRAANERGAHYLGDKGVGRLSSMRLGDHLHVSSTTISSKCWNVLDIDWNIFTHENDLDATEINIVPVLGERKVDSNMQGTTILISSLTTDWDRIRFEDLLEGRIARFIDPFIPGLGNNLMRFYFNDKRILIPSIKNQLLKGAHAVLNLELKFNNKQEPHLVGTINYLLRQGSISIDLSETELMSAIQQETKKKGKQGKAAAKLLPITRTALKKLGAFSAEIYWYNRAVITIIPNLTENRVESRREIAKWSGGPMLYRHNFRILPYGDPEDDWLGLDTAAFGSSGFKLNRQQVIGRIRVNSSHEFLSEQTNREGLIQSEAANALIRILRWALHSEMRGLINRLDKTEQLNRRLALDQANHLTQSRQRVIETLEKLENSLGDEHLSLIHKLARQIDSLTSEAKDLHSRLDLVIQEASSEREKFVYLAGVGLMTEFIFHELDRTINFALKELNDSARTNIKSLLYSLTQQLTTLSKRVAAFDELTGAKRQVKSKFSVKEVIDEILSAHENEFARHKISVYVNEVSSQKSWTVNAVKGMFIQIIENLLSNSLYWIKQHKKYEDGFEPLIEIFLDQKNHRISLTDNGPGIDQNRSDLVFEPFVTSKPPGQGRGLGLYISRELANYHNWSIFLDSSAPVLRKNRINTIALDLGDTKNAEKI